MRPIVERAAQLIRCPRCGYEQPTRIMPLFVVTGASGLGKTSIVAELRRLLPEWEVFETDILQGADWQQVKCNWLRIAHSIAQSGRPTVLCGTMLPSEVDGCDHRDFFSQVYYLNLHCADEARAARLRARPAWRGSTEAFIEEHRKFARWLLENAETAFDPPLETIDTTNMPIPSVAEKVRQWALRHWQEETAG